MASTPLIHTLKLSSFTRRISHLSTMASTPLHHHQTFTSSTMASFDTTMAPSTPLIQKLSSCIVTPSTYTHQTCHLTPWDLTRLNIHYIQQGFLFSNACTPLDALDVADRLKASLAKALQHFYPLSGRFVTEKSCNGTSISVDCDGQGAEFIHSVAKSVTVDDVLSVDKCVPLFVRELCPLEGVINYDGHDHPLLAVQLTELADGFFIGLSVNHAVCDGTSYWHFFNAWASICRGEGDEFLARRPPLHERCFLDGESPIVMPFSGPEEFIERFTPTPFQVRFFHLTAQSMAGLKAIANQENESSSSTISSLQSVISLVWRAIVRARNQPDGQHTTFMIPTDVRQRLSLPPNYFGNAINVIRNSTTVSELLCKGLGWGARLANEAVAEHTECVVREKYKEWLEDPKLSRMSLYEDGSSAIFSSTPRFNMYECDFGWGKAMAVRSGSGSKFNGDVWFYPGRDEGGSINLEVCLKDEYMGALESDEEFMRIVGL